MKFKEAVWFLIVRLVEVLVVLALILVMPNVPPDAKFSTPYPAPSTKPLEGPLNPVEQYQHFQKLFQGQVQGPEAFAVYENAIYTSLLNGDVVRLDLTKMTTEPIAHFGGECKHVYDEKECGRPLGLRFNEKGELFVCDAYFGIWKVDVKTRAKVRLVSPEDEIEGKKPKLFNSLVLASNGDIYWTDSSTQFYLEDGIFDLLADGSGRLIRYNAATKKNTVLIDKLRFANGVNIADDESFIVVCDLCQNRILRYYLKGEKKGTHDVFVDGLPGLPDNINTDGGSGFLVGLVVAVDNKHPLVPQALGPFPLLRKLVARILGLLEGGFKLLDRIYPNEFAKRGVHFVGHFQSFSFLTPKRSTVVHLSKNGEIMNSINGRTGDIKGISDGFVFDKHLYLGSPFNDYIPRAELKSIGLEALEGGISNTRKIAEAPKPVTQKPREAPKSTSPPPTAKPVVEKKPEVKTVPVQEKKVILEEKTSPPPVEKEPKEKKPVEQKQAQPAKSTPSANEKKPVPTEKVIAEEKKAPQPEVKKAPPVEQKKPVEEVKKVPQPEEKKVPVAPKIKQETVATPNVN